MKTFCFIISVFCVTVSHTVSAQCWNLVYEDTFDGTGPQSKMWTARDQPGFSQSNGELQYHLTQNVSVAEGLLHLIAKRESYNNYQYTSGWIDSKFKVNFRYGRIVSRMKLPPGKGFWPAFWLVPEKEAYGEWPNSGEIDIMESIGSDTKTVYGTFHTVDQSGVHVSNSVPFTFSSPQDFTTAFHDFELQWTPTELRWYVDGTLYSSQNRSSYPSWKWPFDQQFYIIYSLAVGGTWPGAPTAQTVFPSELVVDYVRVYQGDGLIEIVGSAEVERNSTTSYSVPNYQLSTYNWQAPLGATIISGQGTNTVQVKWGAYQNMNVDLKCTFRTPCSGTPIVATKSISLVSNVLDNPGFELGYSKWFRNNASGFATFSLDQNNPGQQTQSAKVEIASASPEYWRSQLSRNVYGLSGGDSYEVRFLARSDVPGRIMGVSVLNPVTYSTIGTSTFTLSDQWRSFQFSVDLTSLDTAALLTLDLGHSAGTFWFDDVTFGKKPDPLPVKLISFSGEFVPGGTLLNWSTAFETNNAYFEIERSLNAKQFVKIGVVKGNSTTEREHFYGFLDPEPGAGVMYYRLKQVDFDGHTTLSKVIHVRWGTKQVSPLVFAPNPVSDYVEVLPPEHDQLVALEICTSDGKIIPLGFSGNRARLTALPAGSFILRARMASGQIVSRKIVKK